MASSYRSYCPKNESTYDIPLSFLDFERYKYLYELATNNRKKYPIYYKVCFKVMYKISKKINYKIYYKVHAKEKIETCQKINNETN